MSTDNKPLKITVWIDREGKLDLRNFYFPRDWSYEQRKEFISNYSQVLKVEVTVHESDLLPFEHNMSVEEYEEAMSNFYEHAQKTRREYWEAQDFEDQRGDV
jgi:hypothetical protein